MIEYELRKFWLESLSFKELAKDKEYKVVYNWKAYVILALLGVMFLIINILTIYPVLDYSISVITDNFEFVLVCCAIVCGLIAMLLLQFGKPRFELRWLVDKRKKDINLYELKEEKLRKHIEEKYIDVIKDNTEFYRDLIR